MLSVLIAGEFWGQQHHLHFLKLHRRFPGGSVGLSESTRSTLSPTELHMLTLVLPLIHLSFFQTSLMSLEWQLGVGVIKGYWSI